jgi:diguanylate cyclase (GGDEF)-like protein
VVSPAGVTEEQLHAMWAACLEISGQPSARQACRLLAERLTRIIGAPVVVFRRDVSPWKLVSSGEEAPPASLPTIDQLEDVVTWPDTSFARPGLVTDPRWTPVPLDEEMPSQALLLLPGDWRTGPAAQWLPRFAKTASMALRLAAARHAARQAENLTDLAYSFARRLVQTHGVRALHQLIVDTAAATANASLASLAVYHPKDGALSIQATHGYPSETVSHVRIVPGSGIIGGIFTTKKPVLVRDTTRVPGLTPRSQRYRTASFMGIPIVSREDALGVLTLADRQDGQPFSRRDLSAARLITTTSSLALVREQLARLVEELSHTAAIDPLTGMFNRRYLETRLVAELERSRRTTLPVAVLMVDVDTFKGINDQLGHQTGDTVLRRVSEVIRRSMRASDVCTRYGGDEFAIIVSESAHSAVQTAERIRNRVEAYRWEALGIPQALHVTLSIGVAIGEPGENADSLIGRADQHLYQAKALGRNCVYPAEG